MDEIGQSRHQPDHRHHRRLPGRDATRISSKPLSLLETVEYDAVFAFKYSPRPNTPAVQLDDAIP